MIIPSLLGLRYTEFSTSVALAGDSVKATLHGYCERNNFAFQSRVKSVDSLAEKIETGRYACWSQIDDLFACTVIIPNLGKEDNVVSFCESAFEVLKTTRRGSNLKEPDVFRFDSTRVWCRVRTPESGIVPPSPNQYEIIFEVQIRTAFEHAWSVTMHPLVYKSDTVEWQRLRLAAEIKATLEQLDALVMAFDQVAEYVARGTSLRVNRLKAIADSASTWLNEGKIPSDLSPRDVSRFAENLDRILVNSGLEKDYKAILATLNKSISLFGAHLIPKSTTLLQFTVAVLVDERTIDLPINDYRMHVTSELTSLFPNFGSLSLDERFDYDS